MLARGDILESRGLCSCADRGLGSGADRSLGDAAGGGKICCWRRGEEGGGKWAGPEDPMADEGGTMEVLWIDTGETVAEEFLGLTWGVLELLPRPVSLWWSMRIMEADTDEGEGPLCGIRYPEELGGGSEDDEVLLDIRSGVGGALLLWAWPARSFDTLLLLLRWFALPPPPPLLLLPSPAPLVLGPDESFRCDREEGRARRRARTASRWSRRCVRRSLFSSNSPFSSLSWCKDDSNDATGKLRKLIRFLSRLYQGGVLLSK